MDSTAFVAETFVPRSTWCNLSTSGGFTEEDGKSANPVELLSGICWARNIQRSLPKASLPLAFKNARHVVVQGHRFASQAHPPIPRPIWTCFSGSKPGVPNTIGFYSLTVTKAYWSTKASGVLTSLCSSPGKALVFEIHLGRRSHGP